MGVKELDRLPWGEMGGCEWEGEGGTVGGSRRHGEGGGGGQGRGASPEHRRGSPPPLSQSKCPRCSAGSVRWVSVWFLYGLWVDCVTVALPLSPFAPPEAMLALLHSQVKRMEK